MHIITEAMHNTAPTKRIRFTRNTCEGGVDYGPDYPEQVCELGSYRAAYYVRTGRAVEVAPEAEVQASAPADLPPAAPAQAAGAQTSTAQPASESVNADPAPAPPARRRG